MATQHQDPHAVIHYLVERFERNIGSYLNQAYNETQVRREFIDPFFETLGWKRAMAKPIKTLSTRMP